MAKKIDQERLRKEFYLRHSSFMPLDVAQSVEVTLIGGGAIGSWLTLILAKYGFRVSVIDFDQVDYHNLANQFFRLKDIGRHKVDALSKQLKEYAIQNPLPVKGMVLDPEDESKPELPKNILPIYGPLTGIVIPAVDSMRVRKIVYKICSFYPGTWECIIDPRMGLTDSQIVYVTPETLGDYIGSGLDYSDEEVVGEQACTAKVCPHTAMMVSAATAATVVSHVRNTRHLNKVPVPIMPHTVIYSTPVGVEHETYDREKIAEFGIEFCEGNPRVYFKTKEVKV